jgi:hypothetical protein
VPGLPPLAAVCHLNAGLVVPSRRPALQRAREQRGALLGRDCGRAPAAAGGAERGSRRRGRCLPHCRAQLQCRRSRAAAPQPRARRREPRPHQGGARGGGRNRRVGGGEQAQQLGDLGARVLWGVRATQGKGRMAWG